MDEVMADVYEKLIDCYTEEFAYRPLPEAYQGKKIYDLPNAHHIRNRLHEVGFFSDVAVMENCRMVIERLQENYEVFVVTATQEFRNSLADKHTWLETNFPSISWRNYVMCGDKSVVTGDYMIDDKVSNLKKFNGTGLLFTSPHNVYDEGYTRVNNWLEVAAFFEQA